MMINLFLIKKKQIIYSDFTGQLANKGFELLNSMKYLI